MKGAIVESAEVAGRSEVRDSADVVIVGSGAAGATAARVLAGAGLDVIVVEEGPWLKTSGRALDAYSAFKGAWRDGGFRVAKGRAFMPILQGSCVGGTTTINGAILHRLPERVFDGWVKTHGFGASFRYDDLVGAWGRLDRELSVGEAPDEVLGGNNRLLREALLRKGIEGRKIHRNVRDCEGSARCNQGCPTGRKQSMEVSFIPHAVERGARVYATCKAERFVLDGDRARGVIGRFRGPRGPRLVVHARHAVVVAASAIETPLLLSKEGIGRRSGLVGRRFQAHPAAGVLGVFDRPVDMWSGATQGYETLAFWHERMKFETASVPLEILAARLPGYGAELMSQLADATHVAQWGVEVRAEAHGRVKRSLFGGPDIRYDLTGGDVALLKTGVKRLAEWLFAAGAREVLPGVHGLSARATSFDEIAKIDTLPDDPRLFHAITGHLFGTAVMGEDPKASVVDLDGQTRDVRGLYVLDASIFPTNIGVNPQHSIAALAWVLAERLASRCFAAR